MKKKIKLILFFILLSSIVKGQGWLTEENTIETNWNVTIQFGSNLLLGELKKDFSGFNNNMNSYPDMGFSIQLSKMAWERIDLGVEFGTMGYHGINSTSATINYLMFSETFNNVDRHFIPYPVEYKTNLLNLSFFTKYNFINFSSYLRSFIKLNMFVRFGLGVSYLSGEMGYDEKVNYQLSGLTDPLFSSKRDLDFLERFNGFVSPAFGLNYQISERFFVSSELGFLFCNTGLIDGVYNMNGQLTPDIDHSSRNEFEIPVFDLSGKFMFGVTYFFNFDTHRKTRTKAFPWYYNRYRSYFSKYHAPATKRIIKQRLPFYNNNFDE